MGQNWCVPIDFCTFSYTYAWMTQAGRRWPKTAPRWLKDGPKTAQDGHKMAPRRALTAPRRPKMAPSVAQERPKMVPRRSPRAPRAPKDLSKTPLTTHLGHKALKASPCDPKVSPKWHTEWPKRLPNDGKLLTVLVPRTFPHILQTRSPNELRHS